MSSDVSMYDEELKSLEDEVAGCLRAMDTLTGDARLDKYNRANELLKKIGKAFHQYKYEVRMLEGSEQNVYEKKAQEHQQTIASLKDRVAKKRNEANAAPSPSSPGSPGDPYSPKNDGKDQARGTAKHIGKTQDSTLKSLANTEKLIASSEDQGQEAATTLKAQTEQIKDINQKLDVLDSQVARAKKELNLFIRRMMTDKLILCFGFLVVVGIIVIIVMKLKNKDEGPAKPSIAPHTDAPKTEEPKTEAPKTEAPKTEAPTSAPTSSPLSQDGRPPDPVTDKREQFERWRRKPQRKWIKTA